MTNNISDFENPWITNSKVEKYDNQWIQVEEHQVLNPSGNPGIYGVVHFKNLAIGVIPIDNENNIWLVGQYRYPLNCYSWEIPEGGGKLNIPPIDSAKRELKEETGLTANYWKKILEMHLSNSVSDEKAIVFLAKQLSLGESEPEETEKLNVIKIPFDKAYQMVLNFEITDSLSVAAILRLKIMLLQGEL